MKNKEVEQSGEFAPNSERSRNFERIFSLYDMKKLYADRISLISAILAELMTNSRRALDGGSEALYEFTDLSILNFSNISKDAQALGLRASMMKADYCFLKFGEKHTKNEPILADKVEREVTELHNRFTDELKDRFFMHVTKNELQRYRQKHPFGDTIGAKWPDIQTDLQEANKCRVLRRYSACVLHLMRATEFLVQRIAHHYGVQPTYDGKPIPIEEEVWGRLTPKIKTKIEEREKAGTSNSHDTEIKKIIATLNTIRALWRNDVAHPKRHFTRGEAIAIFDMSKGVAMGLLPLL